MLRGLRGCCVLGRVHLFVFFALFMLQTGLYVYLAFVFVFFLGGFLFLVWFLFF